MHKSNTNSEKYSTIIMKILKPSKNIRKTLSDSSIILYCYSSIFQRKKLEMYSRSLKKDDKLTP